MSCSRRDIWPDYHVHTCVRHTEVNPDYDVRFPFPILKRAFCWRTEGFFVAHVVTVGGGNVDGGACDRSWLQAPQPNPCRTLVDATKTSVTPPRQGCEKGVSFDPGYFGTGVHSAKISVSSYRRRFASNVLGELYS